MRLPGNIRDSIGATILTMEARVAQFKSLLFIFVFLSSFASAQNYPARESQFVNDFANILDDQTEERITQALSELQQSRNVEMTVVTLESMTDYGFSGEIEPFATGLFNTWALGDATRNDGIMMLVAIQDRAMRIELGAGYPKALDKTAKTIIDEIMIPQFKNGNFASGIEKGVFEASHLLRLDADTSYINDRSSSLYTQGESTKTSPVVIFLEWAAGIFAGLFGIFRVNKWRRERPRHCLKCKGVMELLPDNKEDAHLSAGQQTEEHVNSVQYDVWYCPADESIQICDYQKWFSGYCKCKFCKNKTLGSDSETIKRATEYSTGIERVTFLCEHCNKTWEEMHTIPVITRSSSSSSSGSSGGGSSSGGGASGRW
jgi:uncharacterized protein